MIDLEFIKTLYKIVDEFTKKYYEQVLTWQMPSSTKLYVITKGGHYGVNRK